MLRKNFYVKTDTMPIQGIIENSSDAMRRHMSIRITEVGIDYENGKAVTYKLSHPRIKGHVNHIDFEKEFKNQRSEDTRSIYFFKLRRMIEFLEIDPTVTPKILKPVYGYYDLREKQYEDVYMVIGECMTIQTILVL